MKTIGACFVKIGGSVRLALIQENNGVKSVVPVGGAFAHFACAPGTAVDGEGRTQSAPTVCVAGTLTPGPSPTSGEGSQSAPTLGEGSQAGQTHRSAPTVGVK